MKLLPAVGVSVLLALLLAGCGVKRCKVCDGCYPSWLQPSPVDDLLCHLGGVFDADSIH